MTALSRHRSFLGCAALLALSAGWNVGVRLAAQSAGGENILDQAIVTAFKWRSIGPDRGGRSIAVSGVKGRPREGYFGATGGGLWKTIDGGAKWAPVTDGQIRSASVGAVAVSESKPDIVFIGTGESCIRGNIMPGDGVYKSADAGKTWTHSGFSNSDAISKIRIHPTNPDVVFVADFGRYGAPSDERGLYKSTDGGKTWQRKLFRDGKTGAVDVEIDRRNPNVLFAAMWEAYRVEYQMSSGGPGSGLFKSTDGGDTWREITRNPGLPQGMVGKISIAISGADSNRVYALVENENGGLFSSDDAGATWKLVNTGRNIRQRAFYYTHVFADPNNRDIVYALNTSAFRSTDGGRTLAQIGQGTHGDHHDLWIDPGDSQHVILGNDGGGAITYNVAAPQRSWSRQDFPTEQFYHVITTRHAPFHVCGAQQDNSTLCVPSNNGVQPFYPVGGGEPGYIAPDPKDVDVFFAGANNGSFLTRFNRRTGEQREVGPYPRFFSGENSASVVERWQWTYPIIFSPVDPNVLYTSSQRVWKTTNGGQTWDAISGDLTRHDPKTMQDSGGPITHDMNSPEIYATIFSLGPGKTDVNVIWAGSDDGIVQVTRDGGRNWINVTPKDMPDLGRVSQIDASAFDAGTAYIAVKKPLLTDFNPYIFRTHDYGRTWTKIVAGIAANDYTHVVREDPTRRGLLYAGTQHGFYLSYDDGDRWQALGTGLPDTPVSDIWVEANDIAIATHGRGFYVLDEVGPLRQYGSAVTSATDAYLFKPGDAIRSGGPARITYWLKRPAQNLTLEILDSNGQAIRTFAGRAGGSGESGGAGRSGGTGGSVVAGASGGAGAAGQPAAVATNTAAANTTAEAEQPPADEEEGGGRGRGPLTASMAAGVTRFNWDLQYAPVTAFQGMVLWGATTNGPTALPGTYQARLTVDGRAMTQPITVKKHPFFTVSDADLREQFELASRIRDKVNEANDAIIQIRRIKQQLADRVQKSQSADVKAIAEQFTKELVAVEEDVYQVRNQSNQDPLNFPIKTNNRLASLLRVVLAGDGKPVGNAVPIFNDLQAELKAETDRLQRVLTTYLPRFNQLAQRLGIEAINEK